MLFRRKEKRKEQVRLGEPKGYFIALDVFQMGRTPPPP